MLQGSIEVKHVPSLRRSLVPGFMSLGPNSRVEDLDTEFEGSVEES